MSQQDQARKYFHRVASEWQDKSVNAAGSYSLIDGRHRAVHHAIAQSKKAGRFLDVGCGTGQLAIEVAGRGWQSEGNDFADAMIAQCRDNATKAGVEVIFKGGSFFDIKYDDDSFDVISAQGFIEYISTDEMDEFFRRSARMLRRGGALVVGSRNRLYNAIALNEFTRLEAELGTLIPLILEATTLQSIKQKDEMLAAIRRHERIDPQPDKHPITGILVETRYQFTPAELTYRLRRFGLKTANIYPVHFHGLPTSIKAENPTLHSDLALVAADIGTDEHRLVPFCSTFVIEARLE